MNINPTPRDPEQGEYVRGHGRLLNTEVTEPPPQPPPKTYYIFESITAHVEVRMNNETIRKGSSYWDFQSEGSSIQSAIEEAKQWIKKFNIKRSSDTYLVVVKKISQVRKVKLKDEVNPYNRIFNAFEYSVINSHVGEKSEVVWNSKKDWKK